MTVFDEREREIWAGVADAYAASYARLCAYTVPALLDAAGVTGAAVAEAEARQAPLRVLDVGTGPGTVARAAVDRGATVTAVDAEPSMVAAARSRVPEAAVVEAVLPDLPLPGATFDAVVANFVLNHVGRPRAALAELIRVARPGGRIAVGLWTAEGTAGSSLLRRAIAAAPDLVAGADLPALDPAEDYRRSREGVAELLREAGLRAVECVQVDWVHLTTVEEWWSSIPNGVAGAAQVYRAQPAGTRELIHQAYLKLAEELRDEQGRLALPYTALIAYGTVGE